MRKLLFFASILLITFTSCNNDKKTGDGNTEKQVNENKDSNPATQTLVGKWKLVEIAREDLAEEEKKQMLGSTTVEFTSSGKYSSSYLGESENGNYTFDASTSRLTTIMDNNNGIEQKKTVTWEGDLLVISGDKGQMKFRRL